MNSMRRCQRYAADVHRNRMSVQFSNVLSIPSGKQQLWRATLPEWRLHRSLFQNRPGHDFVDEHLALCQE